MTTLTELYTQVKKYGPVSASLSKLIRPTIQAADGKVLIWCDWSAIEARTNPWLANSVEADEQVLRLFREGVDIYIENAKDIFNVEHIDKETTLGEEQRQSGKVAVLSLGFLGSVGALKAMARGYGMRLSDEQAKLIVDGWRARNTWARHFGYESWDAFQAAIQTPGQIFEVGRLAFEFKPELLGGSVLCWLPSGRPLVYPDIRMGMQENVFTGDEEFMVTYNHGHGRARMWAGKVIQGPTQACAADLLRRVLVALDPYSVVVAHTHDEVVIEVPEDEQDYWAKLLKELMLTLPAWADDKLPLEAKLDIDFFYHK